MAFLGLFGNYDKPGPGVNKDEPPKAAPIRFFEIFFRKFSKLVQANLIFVLPTLAAAALMFLLYLFPTHYFIQFASAGGSISLDVWALYVVPMPLILLAPFTAGLTFIARNFAREEHAFIWTDFWKAVKNNWKYFLANGAIIYLVYVILSFSMIYYYNKASEESLMYVPFWLCIVISILFLFAQYYLPVMFVTFDLKFGQAYKNAFIFSLAGLGRNLIITVVLGVIFVLLFAVMPLIPLTIMFLLLLFFLIFFSFCAFLINFTIYPIINGYLIAPYEKKLAEEKNGTDEAEKDPLDEKYAGLFSQADEEEEEETEEGKDEYVYINGKLVKKSELKPAEREDLEEK